MWERAHFKERFLHFPYRIFIKMILLCHRAKRCKSVVEVYPMLCSHYFPPPCSIYPLDIYPIRPLARVVCNSELAPQKSDTKSANTSPVPTIKSVVIFIKNHHPSCRACQFYGVRLPPMLRLLRLVPVTRGVCFRYNEARL